MAVCVRSRVSAGVVITAGGIWLATSPGAPTPTASVSPAIRLASVGAVLPVPWVAKLVSAAARMRSGRYCGARDRGIGKRHHSTVGSGLVPR